VIFSAEGATGLKPGVERSEAPGVLKTGSALKARQTVRVCLFLPAPLQPPRSAARLLADRCAVQAPEPRIDVYQHNENPVWFNFAVPRDQVSQGRTE
jgi:hypothetical protein